ncbi:MAG: SPOR domain-containing protein [Trichlorobacter sp.]|jgi:outer membrane biosynthesis protein TonB
MDFKYDKQSAGDAASQGQDKGRQTILLVVLLIMLGGFGYLYFFTGMIRPLEQSAPPQAAPQVVKQPLPAREGEPVGAPSTTAPTAAPAVPVTAPVAAAKPAGPAKAVVTPVPQPAVKPVQPPPPAPVGKKTAPPAAKPEVKKAVQQTKVVQPKPVPAAKTAPTQPAAPKKIAAKPAVKPVVQAKTGGPWTLVVGAYVVEERLATDMAKVKDAGLNPAMTSGPRRMTTMHRLKYGEYTDREVARQAVELLRKQAGDGFSLQNGGKYEVFAGSYAQQDSAQAEQQRLSAAGIKLTVQKVQVVVPTRKLTAGTFTNRPAAEAALKKLKQAGVGTPVLE